VAVRYRFQHADGTWRHIEAEGVNLLDDPAIGGIVVNSRDVTAQQRLENQLLQAQKMEAVGRFAGGVAHDFNNILTAIKSYSQLALDELNESSPVREDLLEIERAADRAATLTRQILAFSRQQVLRPRVLDLNETIGGIENMLRRLMMTDVALETRLAADLGSVEADPGQIEQVLMNLVVNARDAMPEGGHITIATANGDGPNSQPVLEPHGFPPGPYVVLTVSDTGEGMSRETQAKIFEPFFTTKDQGKGTGLGLSTVYGIIKQSGGYICVYSESGQGTTFKIFLPRVDVTAEHRIPSVAGLPRAGGPECILLVEDDSVLRAISRRVLTRVGYEVLEAENGCDALLMIEEHGNGISLVITDLIMPKMRGTELLSEIRKRHGWLPVLLVSGYTEDAMIRKGSIDADTNFLEKPFTPDVLIRAVRKILDGRNLVAAPVGGVGSRRLNPVS
jgi:signal transduction histidine kinase/ActR/RegA family two-component response regulator